jgi:hypothetical protein
MDLATSRRNRVSVAQLVRRTLRELEGVREILSRGNGADRQLRLFNANRDIVEVVSEIADATQVAAVPLSARRPHHGRGVVRAPHRRDPHCLARGDSDDDLEGRLHVGAGPHEGNRRGDRHFRGRSRASKRT